MKDLAISIAATAELTAAQVKTRLEAAGYTNVQDVKKEGYHFDAWATAKGQRVSLHVDAKTGAITPEEENEKNPASVPALFYPKVTNTALGPSCATERPLQHYREVPRVTVILESDELELFERAARALAERARRDAEGCQGNSIEQLHRGEQARFLRLADRLRAAQSRPDPEPPPDNVRPLRPE